MNSGYEVTKDTGVLTHQTIIISHTFLGSKSRNFCISVTFLGVSK